MVRMRAAREIEEMAAAQDAVRVIEENLQQREFPRALKSGRQPANCSDARSAGSGSETVS